MASRVRPGRPGCAARILRLMNRRDVVFRSMTAALLGPLAGLGGCSDSPAAKRIAEGESIFALFETAKPADAARDMVNPYDADKRFRGTYLISNAPWGGQDVYVAVYVDQIKNDPDMGVRAVAAWALAMHGKPEHAELIVPLLDPANGKFVRLSAARSLQRLHNPKVVDAIIETTDTRRELDPQVRAECCTALGQYAETRVLQALIKATDDDSLVVNKAALDSLKTLTGQEFGADPRPWVKWSKETANPFALRTQYTYPVFNRDRDWLEYIPFVPQPPNETPASPAGLSPVAGPAPAAEKPR